MCDSNHDAKVLLFSQVRKTCPEGCSDLSCVLFISDYKIGLNGYRLQLQSDF